MASPLSKIITAQTGRKALEVQTLEYLDRLEKLLAPDVIKPLTAVHDCGQAKQVNIELPDKYNTIELLFIGDVQFGHKDCKYSTVQQYVKWVLAKPNRFVGLTGDLIDAAHAFTPGSTWDNMFEQQSQVYRFVEALAPMRHRVIGYVGGNHERRGIPVFGDLGFLLATMLRVPYSNGRQYINLTFGQHKPFRILLWHGHPRARTKGALAQIMDRFTRIGNAQLYVTAHNHQSLVVPGCRELNRQGDITLEDYVGMSGTSFLTTYGSYGEWMGFESYNVLMPRVNLHSDGTWEAVIRCGG